MTHTFKLGTRRVMQNETSFFLCLPNIYCKTNNLRKGDIFSFEWNIIDDTIIIRREGNKDDRTNTRAGETVARDGAEDKVVP
jgi:bifunctional DNA-binding transcriptional regulator/antitoxin component of YhaV-PrlF toxin-antitoxin module